MVDEGKCACNEKFTGIDCSLTRPKCRLHEVNVGGLCCFEGKLNDDGICQDICSSARPINIAGYKSNFITSN